MLLELYRYTAFGQVETYSPTGNQLATTAIDNPVLWNSRRYDEATQLHYYKYRHYSPKLGRWLGIDPIGEDGGINLYAFVGNDPVDRWDRLGTINWNHNNNPIHENVVMDPAFPMIKSDVYTVKTGLGRDIPAWQGKGENKGKYTCHGYTFGGSPNLTIWGEHVPSVLVDDGWKHIPCCLAKKEDIVLHFDRAQGQTIITHSGIIQAVERVPILPNSPGVSRLIVDLDKSNVTSKPGFAGDLTTDSFKFNRDTWGLYGCYSKIEPSNMDTHCCYEQKGEFWKDEWYNY